MLCNSKSGSANDSVQTLLMLLKTKAPVCLNCYCLISRQQKTQQVLQMHCLNGASRVGWGRHRECISWRGKRWRLRSVGHRHHAVTRRGDGFMRCLSWIQHGWKVAVPVDQSSLQQLARVSAALCSCTVCGVEQCSMRGRKSTLHFRLLFEALQAGAWS